MTQNICLLNKQRVQTYQQIYFQSSVFFSQIVILREKTYVQLENLFIFVFLLNRKQKKRRR